MAFETVSEATRLWIKGREFSVKRLLGETYGNEFAKYDGGALGIFRLAPQVSISSNTSRDSEADGESRTIIGIIARWMVLLDRCIISLGSIILLT